MKLSEIKVDKSQFQAFSSFEEAENADREYWHSRSPADRMEALELMRQSTYGYDDPTTERLQRVLEIVRGEES